MNTFQGGKKYKNKDIQPRKNSVYKMHINP